MLPLTQLQHLCGEREGRTAAGDLAGHNEAGGAGEGGTGRPWGRRTRGDRWSRGAGCNEGHRVDERELEEGWLGRGGGGGRDWAGRGQGGRQWGGGKDKKGVEAAVLRSGYGATMATPACRAACMIRFACWCCVLQLSYAPAAWRVVGRHCHLIDEVGQRVNIQQVTCLMMQTCRTASAVVMGLRVQMLTLFLSESMGSGVRQGMPHGAGWGAGEGWVGQGSCLAITRQGR